MGSRYRATENRITGISIKIDAGRRGGEFFSERKTGRIILNHRAAATSFCAHLAHKNFSVEQKRPQAVEKIPQPENSKFLFFEKERTVFPPPEAIKTSHKSHAAEKLPTKTEDIVESAVVLSDRLDEPFSSAESDCTQHRLPLPGIFSGTDLEFCPSPDDALRLHIRFQRGVQSALGYRHRRRAWSVCDHHVLRNGDVQHLFRKRQQFLRSSCCKSELREEGNLSAGNPSAGPGSGKSDSRYGLVCSPVSGDYFHFRENQFHHVAAASGAAAAGDFQSGDLLFCRVTRGLYPGHPVSDRRHSADSLFHDADLLSAAGGPGTLPLAASVESVDDSDRGGAKGLSVR